MAGKKTIREESIEELFTYIFSMSSSTFTQQEQTLLKEVLINNKTFNDLIEPMQLTTFRQREIFSHAVKRLHKILFETTEKAHAYEAMKTKEKLDALQNYFYKDNKPSPELQELLLTDIDKAGLSPRVVNICTSAGIKTVFDLIKYSRTDFLKHRNSGERSADEVEAFLKEKGLFWNMHI